MIYGYGVSAEGHYHTEKGIPNQDAFKIVKCSDTLAIAAVADGLGSAEYSGVASKLAVETAVKHCEKNCPSAEDTDDMLAVIRASFTAAQNAVELQVMAEDHTLDQYDTTLSLAVLHEDRLFYGHSGDSGIIALQTDGLYAKVTEQQRDENNCVFPLFFTDHWQFGKYEAPVASVFLATDGMYETLFPLYIREELVNIHVPLALYLMDNRRLNLPERTEDEVTAEIDAFIKNIPKEQVNDDKTVAVLVNTEIEPDTQPDEYYQEPDWAALKKKHDEEWKRKAYPHMFAENKP